MNALRFNKLVGKIYEAATDPTQMDRLADDIARAFNRQSAILYLNKKPNPLPEFVRVLSATKNFDASSYSAYAEYYHAHDEWYCRGIKKPLGWVNIGEELIDDTHFERTEFYADWCRRLGTFRVLGTSVQVDDVLASIGVHGTRHGAHFDEGDRKELTRLLPHLQRAFQIHRRLQIAERNCVATLSLIDGLSIGVIIVDKASRILFANPVAERALDAGRGVTVWQGRLQAERIGETAQLQRTIAKAAQTSAGEADGSGGLLRLNCRSDGALSVLIAPLRARHDRFGAEQPAALVVFSETAAQVGAEALRIAFQLTPAEACLAAALAAGEGLSAYAGRTGISPNTVKTQLRQVFAKTGCSRQADLVRTLCNDFAVRLAAAQQRN